MNYLGFSIGKNTKITGDIKFFGRGAIEIGEDVWLGIGCRFYTAPGAGVHIGDRCDVAPEVVFHTGTHELGSDARRAGAGRSKSIHIGPGCWIGLRATLIAGVEIDSGCVVAASSCVTERSDRPNCLLAGIPAKPVRML